MIRNIRLADAKDIRDISEFALGYNATEAVTERQIAKLLADKQHFIRVYEDDTTHNVIGFIHAEAYELLFKAPGFNILALAVGSEHQHKGIGKQLMQAVEAEAPPYGIIDLSVSTPVNSGRKLMRFTNTAAIHVPSCKNALSRNGSISY